MSPDSIAAIMESEEIAECWRVEEVMKHPTQRKQGNLC